VLASLTRGSFSLLLGTGLRKLLGFLALLLAVRAVPRADYGAYVLFEAVLGLLLLLADFGLPASSTRFVAAESGREARIVTIGSALVLRLSITGIFVACTWPARGLVHSLYHSAPLDLLMGYMPWALLLFSLSEFFSHVLLGTQRHAVMALGQVITGLINLAGVVAFVWLGGRGVSGLIWTLMLASGVSLAYLGVAVATVCPIRLRLGSVKALLKFGLPLHLNSLLTIAFTRLDTFLVGLFSGAGAVASYGVALKLPDNVRGLFDSFRLVYFSVASKHFATDDRDAIGEALDGSVRWAAFVFFGAATVAAVGQREIVRLLFSERYLDSAPALPVLMAATALFFVNCLFGSTLVAGAQPRRVVRISLVTAIVNASASLLLIPRLGVMGAAYAALLTHAVAAELYVRSLKHLRLAFHLSCLLKPAAIFGALFLVHEAYVWRGPVLVRSLLVALYLAASGLCGVVRRSDWVLLKAALPRAGQRASGPRA
jgi:O-antigen/teichoic acid export membrane protein